MGAIVSPGESSEEKEGSGMNGEGGGKIYSISDSLQCNKIVLTQQVSSVMLEVFI